VNTRKFPRSLEQAFGPYTSRDFIENDPMPDADRIVIAACAIGAVALVVILAIF
jgi:hypothetical protein